MAEAPLAFKLVDSYFEFYFCRSSGQYFSSYAVNAEESIQFPRAYSDHTWWHWSICKRFPDTVLCTRIESATKWSSPKSRSFVPWGLWPLFFSRAECTISGSRSMDLGEKLLSQCEWVSSECLLFSYMGFSEECATPGRSMEEWGGDQKYTMICFSPTSGLCVCLSSV